MPLPFYMVYEPNVMPIIFHLSAQYNGQFGLLFRKAIALFVPRLHETWLSLMEEISKKVHKLQGPNYRIFRKNRLFVFVLNPVSSYNRQQMHELTAALRLSQEGCINQFNALYVYNSYNGIYDL